MTKLICKYEQNEYGTWTMTITTITPEGEAKTVHHPRNRTVAKNKELALLWAMKPGWKFTTTTEF